MNPTQKIERLLSAIAEFFDEEHTFVIKTARKMRQSRKIPDFSLLRSACCHSNVVVIGGDVGMTHYECVACHDVCEITTIEREKERKTVHECCGSKNYKHRRHCPTRAQAKGIAQYVCDDCKGVFSHEKSNEMERSCPKCGGGNTWLQTEATKEGIDA